MTPVDTFWTRVVASTAATLFSQESNGSIVQCHTLWYKVVISIYFARANSKFAALLAFALCLSTATVLCAHYFDDFAFALAAGLPLLLAWGVLICWSLAFSLHFIAARRWLLMLISVALAFLTPLATLRIIWNCQDVTDIAHFRALRSQYDARIAQLPRTGARYMEFNWGGMLFASRGVTYDETDQLMLPAQKQTARWKARMRNTDLFCGGDKPIGEVLPLGDHYYLTSFGC